MKTDGLIYKQFTKYVTQNILGMLGTSFYIIADTVFISMAAGTNGMTVLNLALPMYNLIFALGALIGIGSATKYALLSSTGEEQASKCFSNGIFWVLLLSLPFILVGAFCPELVMKLMGADATIVAVGRNYNQIYLCCTPFFMLNYLFGAFVRNDGAPTIAMISTLSGSLFNILFDYILMFVCNMGLEGAALATGASPILGISICCIHIFSKKSHVHLQRIRPDFRLLCKSCQLGVSAFVGEMASGVTTVVFNYLILGIAGNVGVAAYGVVANSALVCIAIFNGVAQGAQPLLSMYYGQGEYKHVRQVFRLGLATAFVFALILTGVAYGCTDSLISIFNSEHSTEMASYAYVGLRIYFIGFLFASLNIVLTGYFSATAKVRSAAVTSILRGLVLICGFAVLFAAIWKLKGVWLSFATAEATTFIVGCICLGRNKDE